ncbi:MAG TPA: hypothetical protein VIP46_06060 [Pyrinomonadaceae bacterium]
MSEFIGLLNGLLTGGILVGKICQALAPGNKNYVDEKSGVTVGGGVSAGGVTFFRSNASGSDVVYAYNPSTDSAASVTVPNESDAQGVWYYLPATEKVAFGEAESALVSPQVNVTTGLLDVPPSSAGGPRQSLLKLAFKGLRMGTKANVGSFTISCTTGQLIILSTALTANAMTYMFVRSDKGVAASNENRVPPNNPPGVASGEIEQRFNIDFAALGIDLNDDTIEGQITLEVASPPQALAKLSKAPSEPLHPAEREFFARLSRGEL